MNLLLNQKNSSRKALGSLMVDKSIRRLVSISVGYVIAGAIPLFAEKR